MILEHTPFWMAGVSNGIFHADLVLATIDDAWDEGGSGVHSQPKAPPPRVNASIRTSVPRFVTLTLVVVLCAWAGPCARSVPPVDSRWGDKRPRYDHGGHGGPSRLPEGYDCDADGTRAGIVDEVDRGRGDWEQTGYPDDAGYGGGYDDYGGGGHEGYGEDAPPVPPLPPTPPKPSYSVGLTAAPSRHPPPLPPVSPPRVDPSYTPVVRGGGRGGHDQYVPPSASIATPPGWYTPQPQLRPVVSPELATAPSRGEFNPSRPSPAFTDSGVVETKGPLRGPPTTTMGGGVARRLPSDSQAPMFTPPELVVAPTIAFNHQAPTTPTDGGGARADESESVGLTPFADSEFYK